MTNTSHSTEADVAEAEAALARAGAPAEAAPEAEPVDTKPEPVAQESPDEQDSDKGYDRDKAVNRLQYDIPKDLLDTFDDEYVERMHKSAQKRDQKWSSVTQENSELRRRVEELEAAARSVATENAEPSQTANFDVAKSTQQLLSELGMDGNNDAEKALGTLLSAVTAPLQAKLAGLEQSLQGQAQVTEQRQMSELRRTLESERARLSEAYPQIGESDLAFQAIVDAATRAKKAGTKGDVPSLLQGAAEALWGEPAEAGEEPDSRPKRSKSTQSSRPSRKGSPASLTPEQRELRAARAALQGKSRAQLETIIHG